MRFTIAMPREAIAIPVARHVIGNALRTIGVADTCIADIVLAVSEACANVVRHGGPARDYEVRARVADGTCQLKITDRGRGMATVPEPAPPPDCEGGRGIQIMKAVVDDVAIDTAPGRGTTVSLEKRLDWQWHAGDPAPANLGVCGLPG